MKRIPITALMLAVPLFAQTQFISNHDGSLLVFSNPQLRPTAASPQYNGFILAIDNGALRIFRQSGNPTLANPDISRDASVVSTQLDATPRYVTAIEGVPNRPTLETDQAVRLSGNGRFAMRFDHTSNAYRWYLDSGRITKLSENVREQASRARGRLIADDGTAVLVINLSVVLFPKDSTDLVSRVIGSGLNPTIDDAATTVVWNSPGFGEWGLYDLRTDTLRTQRGADPVLSADGRRVLYRGTEGVALERAVLFDRDKNSTTVLPAPSRFLHTLSGDGKVVWYLSPDGIYRLTIATERLEMMLPLPVMMVPAVNPLPAVPGSLYSIFVSALADADRQASAPLPAVLEGLRVWINGTLSPIQSIRRRPFEIGDGAWTEIRVQIPWDTPVSPRPINPMVERTTDALKYSSVRPTSAAVTLASRFPLLYYSTDEQGRVFATATHEGSQVAVTPEAPARPGETIRLLMGGLGAVSPAVETGAAGHLAGGYCRCLPFLDGPGCFSVGGVEFGAGGGATGRVSRDHAAARIHSAGRRSVDQLREFSAAVARGIQQVSLEIDPDPLPAPSRIRRRKLSFSRNR